MNFVVVGANGKFGSEICKRLKALSHNVYQIDKEDNIEDLRNMNISAIIDVSNAKNSLKSLYFAQNNSIPIIIGCTGHSQEDIEIIINASKQIPVFLSYNFSIGILALKKALEKMLEYCPNSAYIFEMHHSHKKDAPSGTAKEIIEIVKDSSTEIKNVECIREGKVVGVHEICLFWNNEYIKISHDAQNRDCFVDGAVKAVEFIASAKVGFYGMNNLNF